MATLAKNRLCSCRIRATTAIERHGLCITASGDRQPDC
jgi:hypothetical protein